jgi:cell division protein FtsQ
MARVKQKRLRGSVMQNNASRKRGSERGLLFKIRVGFILATIGLLLLTALWMWLSGWAAYQVRRAADAGIRLTQRAHFAVKDVVVEGRRYTSKDELAEALDVKAGSPILAFSPAQAYDRITGLPWVAEATVERRLPDTLYVRLTERRPMARWQHDGATVVIDSEGAPIPNASPADFPDLLLVAGDKAPEDTKHLLISLKKFPAIMALVQSAVRVSERRWNLYLQSGQIVRLPENNVADAVRQMEDLIKSHKILDRNVTTIDLRYLPDQLVLEPAESANKESGAKATGTQ